MPVVLQQDPLPLVVSSSLRAAVGALSQSVEASPVPAAVGAVSQPVEASLVPAAVGAVSQPVEASPVPAAVGAVSQPVEATPVPAAVGAVSQPVEASPVPATVGAVSQPVEASPSPDAAPTASLLTAGVARRFTLPQVLSALPSRLTGNAPVTTLSRATTRLQGHAHAGVQSMVKAAKSCSLLLTTLWAEKNQLLPATRIAPKTHPMPAQNAESVSGPAHAARPDARHPVRTLLQKCFAATLPQNALPRSGEKLNPVATLLAAVTTPWTGERKGLPERSGAPAASDEKPQSVAARAYHAAPQASLTRSVTIPDRQIAQTAGAPDTRYEALAQAGKKRAVAADIRPEEPVALPVMRLPEQAFPNAGESAEPEPDNAPQSRNPNVQGQQQAAPPSGLKMIYSFRSWGKGHVEISDRREQLVLQPSDPVVRERIAAALAQQEGAGWQLADESDRDRQSASRPQQEDEDDVC
ncbi:SpaN/EivJ family type III secretion system needle length determinant [[Erwinia] mediterraneensis]|uniref:SpaN/EivJ family type III secretion system needle length determinant n=1 Tax=[Erwinia] mediterraneensis TaxID=2161819 RepID=UPI001030ED52|nr:hypothetical protein [[Erwinia] mediterraneensis]